jgi:hypothetical protein
MGPLPDIVIGSTELGADFFLRAATAAVRRACGWHVCPSVEVAGSVPTTGSRVVRLPLMNVTGVSSLVMGGDDVTTSAMWTRDGLVELPDAPASSVSGLSFVAVAGYDPDECPDLVAVIVQAARRAQSAPAGYVRSQSVNGASVTYGGSEAGAPSVTLLASELARLAPYTLARMP